MSTAPSARRRHPPALLDDSHLEVVRRGFRESLRADAASEEHLRGVLQRTIDHPGSLVRAQLAFGILRGRGCGEDAALAIAIAIEYFHTASLIFDDLPCMDGATTRRGQICPHIVHGEAAAVLGALALINRAYELLWEVLADVRPGPRRAASRLVARCLGAGGILDGQALDLHFRGGPGAEALVARVAEGKTVSLVRLSLLLPAVVAGASAEELEALDRLAHGWGLGYQILDDFKDGWMSGAETGKSAGMDRRRRRPNLPAATGIEPALGRLDSELARARAALAGLVGRDARWRLLERLQSILEEERCKVRERLPVAAGV